METKDALVNRLEAHNMTWNLRNWILRNKFGYTNTGHGHHWHAGSGAASWTPKPKKPSHH